MLTALVYVPTPALQGLQHPPLPDLDDAEASMLRVTASSLVEQALAWGSARGRFHGYHLEAQREEAPQRTVVNLRISRDGDVVAQEQVAVSKGGRDAARRDPD